MSRDSPPCPRIPLKDSSKILVKITEQVTANRSSLKIDSLVHHFVENF